MSTSSSRWKWIRRERARCSGALLAIVLVPGLGVTAAHAHGYMTYPSSRAAEHLHGDSKGWPIAGIKAKFRREPCLGLGRSSRPTTVPAGPLQLRFLFPDGANHVGACSAFLLDPHRPDERVRIGAMRNCARSEHPGPGMKGDDIPGSMSVVITDEVPCDPENCVLQWIWTATHKGERDPDRYEHYDNCADIRIVGAKRTTGADPVAIRAASERVQGPDVAIAQGDVLHMLRLVQHDGGVGRTEALDALSGRIEALPLERTSDRADRALAQTENRRGVGLVRDGRVAEAVEAFLIAYRLDAVDPEITNNLGYAYLLADDPEAAEPLLLRALALAPDRANAWANLGQSYALRGRLDDAAASLVLSYHYSRDREVTRRLLTRMAGGDDIVLARAATRALAQQGVGLGAR